MDMYKMPVDYLDMAGKHYDSFNPPVSSPYGHIICGFYLLAIAIVRILVIWLQAWMKKNNVSIK